MHQTHVDWYQSVSAPIALFNAPLLTKLIWQQYKCINHLTLPPTTQDHHLKSPQSPGKNVSHQDQFYPQGIVATGKSMHPTPGLPQPTAGNAIGIQPMRTTLAMDNPRITIAAQPAALTIKGIMDITVINIKYELLSLL